MMLDTSVLIEVMSNNAKIQDRLERLNESVATSVVTKYELLKAQKEDRAMALLEAINIYDYDGVSAERAARIYKELRKRGRMINELDILIASIAIAHDELLVTLDRDFKNIEQLKVLVL